jgi:polyhydroxybutyrate depolymerase
VQGCRPGQREEARSLERSIVAGGRERRYLVDVPAGDASARLPVVLSFHGIGGSPGDLREVTGVGVEAHARGFLAVHPAGGTVWLRGRMGPGWQIRPEDNRDVALVEAILDQMEALYCIDRTRVFAMGFSNGAHLAHVLACKLPRRIAAIGAVGGGLREMAGACGPAHPVPVVIVHGGADSIVGVEEGRDAAAFWVERNSCSTRTEEDDGCVRHAGCAGGAEVLYCEVPGLGHAWPLAATGDPVDATARILDFFLGSATEGAGT